MFPQLNTEYNSQDNFANLLMILYAWGTCFLFCLQIIICCKAVVAALDHALRARQYKLRRLWQRSLKKKKKKKVRRL